MENGSNKPHQKDIASEYIARKLEKISAALYLLTNHFPESEPLKRTLREASLALLSGSHTILQSSMSGVQALSFNISAYMSELVGYLALARQSGLVSPQNLEVLKEECKALAEMSDGAGPASFELLVGREYFKEGEHTSLLPAFGATKVTQMSQGRTQNTHRKEVSIPSHNGENGNGKRNTGRVSSKRRQAILSYLKDNGKASIKDIAKEVKGCSRKTIQRELRDLTDEGLVVSEGERRWTRYFAR